MFRSVPDALRFLKSGNINKCAIKPRKRDELIFLNEETSGEVRLLGGLLVSFSFFQCMLILFSLSVVNSLLCIICCQSSTVIAVSALCDACIGLR